MQQLFEYQPASHTGKDERVCMEAFVTLLRGTGKRLVEVIGYAWLGSGEFAALGRTGGLIGCSACACTWTIWSG